MINDVRVLRHELRPGDVVTIGKIRFRFVVKPDSDHN
jgi:pSer/pThr/pTyr-binding forkhead associated (FHA) protein